MVVGLFYAVVKTRRPRRKLQGAFFVLRNRSKEVDMAEQRYCPNCRRVLYVSDDGPDTCPVCSSPLLETDGEANETEAAG